jgi:acetoin utilization protein AcuB
MTLRVPLVKAAMTPFPFSISPEASVEDARRMMDEHQIRHLPVVAGERLLGVVSDRDLREPLARGEAGSVLIRDVFERDVYVVELSQRLDVVLDRMLQRRIGSAIVTKENRVVGIFTTVDACSFLLKLLAELFPSGGSHVA